MTKTLTEQWREGTLPDGYYYITSKKWGMLIDRYKDQINDCGNEWRGFDNCQGIVDEVLAPVPSYDEYKELVSKTDELVQKIHILNEQNTKQYNELCEEIKKNNILEKKLEIAAKALDHCQGFDFVQYALKEMEGVK